MKAIDTIYKGYKFRSRLEARWAVFFEYSGYKWEYEKEGYELPSGKYLPDFFLPQFNAWVEVKPVKFTDAEKQKCKELSRFTESTVVMVVGIPNDILYATFYYGEESMAVSLSKYAIGKNWNVLYQPGGDIGEIDLSYVYNSDYIPIRKASEARFEHGESP